MANTDGASGINAADLSEQELQKLTQFKDLTGIEEVKCMQILRANDWNLEVALDLAFEGAYNEDQTIFNHNSPQVEDVDDDHHHSQPNNAPAESPANSSHLRHRHIATSSNASNNAFSSSNLDGNNIVGSPPNPPTSDEPQGLPMVLWNTTAWLLKLPFIMVISTLNAFYDFFASLIRPTLNYDATGTVDRFITEFEEKYGTSHPVFHRGTYSQLLEQGKRDIRFIVIYLHSPTHRDTDRFCTNVIATQRFADFIANENIIFWSCSIYYPEGYKVTQSLKASTYPFVGLIGLKNHKMTAMKKLEGYFELEPFISVLKSATANNEYSLITARLDREERNMATLIRAQQDVAFEESLRVDQEKERKKREEEEKKAEEERLVRAQAEEQSRRQEKLQQMKSSLLEEISTEPDQTDAGSIRIMFKLPNGNRLERRFLKHDPVKYLYYFVFCREPTLFNFKLRTNFPTRDLPGRSPAPEADLDSPDMNTILEKCDLGNNVMLFVHDEDS